MTEILETLGLLLTSFLIVVACGLFVGLPAWWLLERDHIFLASLWTIATVLALIWLVSIGSGA